MSQQNGVTHIVCTPHSSEHFKFDPELIWSGWRCCAQAAEQPYLAHPRCDFHLMFDNIEDAVANPANTPSRQELLLVEFPDHSISRT